MKKSLIVFLCAIIFISFSSFTMLPNPKTDVSHPARLNAKLIWIPLDKSGTNMISLFEIRNMRSGDFEKVSGKKMNFFERIVYGSLRHKLKKGIADDGIVTNKKLTRAFSSEASISKGLYIVLAIFGLGWLGMGILDNFKGSDWLISLLLYLILYIPGLIYSLIKMKKYYK